MRAKDFLLESARVGNKLDDPKEFANALRGFQQYYDLEHGASELEYYKSSFDYLNKHGGKIYRVVFANSPEEVRLNDVNEHWTHDSSQIDYYISNLWTYYGKGKKHAFVIEATVPPMSLSNWGVDLAGNPEEQEVNLVANQNQVVYKLFVLDRTRLVPVQNKEEQPSKLTELFEPATALPLEWERMVYTGRGTHAYKTYAHYARAHDQDGRVIDINFVPMPDDIVDISFDRGGRMDITGKGNAAQVLATVVDAINKYIKAEQPYMISFSASEDSRAKLYQHMIKRLAGSYVLVPPDQYPESEDLKNAQIGVGQFFLLRHR